MQFFKLAGLVALLATSTSAALVDCEAVRNALQQMDSQMAEHTTRLFIPLPAQLIRTEALVSSQKVMEACNKFNRLNESHRVDEVEDDNRDRFERKGRSFQA